MCGIIGVVSRPPTRPTPTRDELTSGLRAAEAAWPDLRAVAEHVRDVDASLHGLPGLLALNGRPDLVAELTASLDRLDALADGRDAELDQRAASMQVDELEKASAELITVRDRLWAVRRDRFPTVAAVESLAGRDAGAAALAGYLVVQQALSAIDRLEVRGRDSAGIHLYVWGHDIAPDALDALRAERGTDPLFQNGAIEVAGDTLSFTYKAAAEIGELGDNTAALRRSIAGDALLRRALASPDARVGLLGHTRWASVGIISEPNTHPVNSRELEQPAGAIPPYVVAALNGDVDNHADLRAEHGLRVPAPITTDAKVIPSLVTQPAAR